MSLRLLVLDAYPAEGREALRKAGGTEAGKLYERMLQRIAPDAAIEIRYPADPGTALPGREELRAFAGVVWTGSSLTIHISGDVRVERQISLARRCLAEGVPSFGSCWGIQLAAVAGGGRCAPNPRGREFGISRRIALDEAGRRHPLYTGKPLVFDAFTSHADEVLELGAHATRLASNAWTRVQALSIRSESNSHFWALQYHPEYDPHEIAALGRLRKGELVAQGTFANASAADAWIEKLEALHDDPTRGDLARELGLRGDVLDEQVRTCEVRNWVAMLRRQLR